MGGVVCCFCFLQFSMWRLSVVVVLYLYLLLHIVQMSGWVVSSVVLVLFNDFSLLCGLFWRRFGAFCLLICMMYSEVVASCLLGFEYLLVYPSRKSLKVFWRQLF